MDVSGSESKVQCCQEQYRTRTWNVRSMNQGILDMVKQEMARVKPTLGDLFKEMTFLGI